MDKVKKALQQTAYENGITASQVEDDIQSIIDECYYSSDQETSKMWRQICPGGAVPTAAQFIAYAVDMINREQHYRKKKFGLKLVF